ncbi:MAG: hypothetical protein M1813_008999 [Trichoglossum hirsutum]|nr:MAG: hypothetical protein M1813_008999 [Trichoglossum hirsutum]
MTGDCEPDTNDTVQSWVGVVGLELFSVTGANPRVGPDIDVGNPDKVGSLAFAEEPAEEVKMVLLDDGSGGKEVTLDGVDEVIEVKVESEVRLGEAVADEVREDELELRAEVPPDETSVDEVREDEPELRAEVLVDKVEGEVWAVEVGLDEAVADEEMEDEVWVKAEVLVGKAEVGEVESEV